MAFIPNSEVLISTENPVQVLSSENTQSAPETRESSLAHFTKVLRPSRIHPNLLPVHLTLQ